MAVAVSAAPTNGSLRVQYARLLLGAGQAPAALAQASEGLRLDPTSAEALDLVGKAASQISLEVEQTTAPRESTPANNDTVTPPFGELGIAAEVPATPTSPGTEDVDWTSLEADIASSVQQPFIDNVNKPFSGERVLARDDVPLAPEDMLDVSRETVTLADVGGLDQVKQRLREAFLEPMRNARLAKAFGKSLRGGLLLYGPPGVGKTYIARAVAGELGARFITVTLADIIDQYFGQAERNLHDLFTQARMLAPAVLFFDEMDAIGGRRSQYTGASGMRTVVNQLLQEMDGIGSNNDGLFILGATNHPWDVDTALLRPGRFDRTVLILPPDAPAREAILRHHFSDRPIAGIELEKIVVKTDGFSGADLSHIVSTAAEKAMMASIAAGEVRPIGMTEVDAALAEIRPSTTTWLQSARNVVAYANADGRYAELAEYLKSRRML